LAPAQLVGSPSASHLRKRLQLGDVGIAAVRLAVVAVSSRTGRGPVTPLLGSSVLADRAVPRQGRDRGHVQMSRVYRLLRAGQFQALS